MAKMVAENKPASLAPAWSRAFAVALGSLSLILGLGSYNPADPSFSSFSSDWQAPKNVLGYLGSWGSDILFQLLGFNAWVAPGLLVVALLRWLWTDQKDEKSILDTRWLIGWSFLTLAGALCLDLLNITKSDEAIFPPQGLLGIGLGAISKPLFGRVGSFLVVGALCWGFVLVWWNSLPTILGLWALDKLQRIKGFFETSAPLKNFNQQKITKGLGGIYKIFSRFQTRIFQKNKGAEKSSDLVEATDASITNFSTGEPSFGQAQTDAHKVSIASPVIRDTISDQPQQAKTPHQSINFSKPNPTKASANPIQWSLPPIHLLEAPKKKLKGPTKEQLLETARKITQALKSFEVEGEVVEISPGPIITMYEFQPASGVRVQKIIATATDLAMNLGVGSVRIVAPIPGKSVAGIEVPNPDKEDILLRDVYESTLDRARSMRLPLVLGKDGEGRPICEDLSRMPHLLIGGATSMGKSVFVNSILTGLLCRFSPENLRLVIVDPKLVEFKIFEDIPHLLLPIVNDPNDASQALKWAVSETKRRYLVMQKYAAKNLEAYNQKISEIKASKNNPNPGEELEVFPYIVIIIDELAELMLTAKRDVEQSIVRLTQLARAAGLHLVMSTQRPSADVVTGLIKSNCPSRAALRVASSSDSRIILDCTGAEQLLGRGDMFFTNTGPMGLRRLQSCYVSDGEIEKVCNHWRDQGEPSYKDDILAPEISDDLDQDRGSNAGELDSLYGDVLDFAKEKGKISTSLIQRRFQIGYTRAARIMEQLESRGIVGEQLAAGKPREVISP